MPMEEASNHLSSAAPREESETPTSPSPRTLDDIIAARLPALTKRERRRLVSRGGVTINETPATDIDTPLSLTDVVYLPPPGPTNPHVSRGAGSGAEESQSPAPPVLPPVLTLDDQEHHSPQEMQELSHLAKARVRRQERESRREHAVHGAPVTTTHPATSHAARGDAGGTTARERFLPGGVRIVHEDADLIVVDKPSGMITADPTRTNTGTVFDILKSYIAGGRRGGRRPERSRDPGGEFRQRIWVIHRLDKEASGLLVFAKTPHAFESLKEEFRAKRAHRLYVAVAEGVIGQAGHTSTIQSFLREEPSGKVVSLDPSKFRGPPRDAMPGVRNEEEPAKLAVTHYRVVAARAAGQHMRDIDGTTLLNIRLETGRKHQIRAHVASIAHPLVGDHRYGAKTDGLNRLALHAAELGFSHPRTGLRQRFASPAPASFYRLVGAEPPAAISPRAPDHAPAPQASGSGSPISSERPARDTSWDRVASWYDELLDDKGNDHYENVILPGAMRLIDPREGMRVLDVACGQGQLCRRLAAAGARPVGLDLSPQLIAAAKRRAESDAPAGSRGDAGGEAAFQVADARELSAVTPALREFDAAACVMALSNIDPLEPVFTGVHAALKAGGVFTFVISHPAFRAAGQTSWEWDPREGKQFRRVDGYLSSAHRRIQMHPGADPSVVTWTFHRPLQTYMRLLAAAGFGVIGLEEWPGVRTSTSGPKAQEENRARREIPLFLAMKCVKM